tara:strand:+ start:194 stop:424 length:231 start_codon:yes stop_codon:yes gene_type:complete
MGKASRRNRQKNPQGFKKNQENAKKKETYGAVWGENTKRRSKGTYNTTMPINGDYVNGKWGRAVLVNGGIADIGVE